MTSASLSHLGLVRRNNEDFVLIDDALGIYLLADGMGGHNAGEVASALAVETAYGCLKAAFAQGIPPDAGLPGEQKPEILVSALRTIQRKRNSRT